MITWKEIEQAVDLIAEKLDAEVILVKQTDIQDVCEFQIKKKMYVETLLCAKDARHVMDMVLEEP